MDETVYKRGNAGKKIEKEIGTRVASLKFKERSVSINKKIYIGRSETNDIGLKGDPLVSRKHALIEKIDDDYYISDLESTNGTSVNNNPVIGTKKVKLDTGDIIKIGKTKFKIVEDAAKKD